jgi:hypothetical protein
MNEFGPVGRIGPGAIRQFRSHFSWWRGKGKTSGRAHDFGTSLIWVNCRFI